MATSTILITRIEQAFFEAVRLKVVADGYTPDITLYPNTPAGYQQYREALAAIEDARGWAVEVFGMSNPQSKGLKQVPRIVFFTDSFLPGDYGLDSRTLYEPDGSGGFTAVTPSQNTSHQLFMKCFIVAKTTSQYRYLSSVINTTLPLRGMLSYAAPLTDKFFVENSSYLDLTSAEHGFIEKVYTYTVPDIIWSEDITVLEAATPIGYIDLNLWIVNRLSIPGEWPKSSDDYDKSLTWVPYEPSI